MTVKELREKMTVKQIKFAHAVVEGLPLRQAYRSCYPKASIPTCDCEGSKLRKNPKVSQYIDLLMAPAAEALVYSRQRKRETLFKIGENLIPDEHFSGSERIQAIKADNDMTGDNKPVRVEGEITLGGIFQALQPTTGLPIEDEQISD